MRRAGDLRGAPGHDDARRLAVEAADRTRKLGSANNFWDGAPGRDVADAKGAAAQALAHAGVRDRALSLAEETGLSDHDRRQRALVAVAAGLRSYGPATAADLIDRQRERLLAPDAHRGWSGRMAELGELFATIADADAAADGPCLSHPAAGDLGGADRCPPQKGAATQGA
ncbi:hypothetical protein ACFYO0_01430 [Streptomyces sp. NPDC006365]|uniref:hypothetical protein n=1 Tax=Streptomyces sp. NPDC006365 TaxID=3364744 RepID=UPI0036CE5EA0